ncbi:MAG: hypothetical protein GC191_11180 [Azospirillum sp.]|nr:hypothetical protein [Azospirillum sp.]
MPDPEPAPPPPRADRLIGLFLFGAVAFNPPLLRVFGVEVMVLGWPFLALYVFTVWAGLIALLAVQIERPDATKRRPPRSE